MEGDVDGVDSDVDVDVGSDVIGVEVGGVGIGSDVVGIDVGGVFGDGEDVRVKGISILVSHEESKRETFLKSAEISATATCCICIFSELRF